MPEAGEHLVDVEQQLALAEAVHHHRDGADFHAVGAEPHEVAGQALQFGDQDADVPDPLRHGSMPSSCSTDEAERQAVGLGAEVVHALDERDHLLPLLLLGRLLDAGVQEARSSGRRRRPSRRRARARAAARRACWGAAGPMLTVIVSVRSSGIYRARLASALRCPLSAARYSVAARSTSSQITCNQRPYALPAPAPSTRPARSRARRRRRPIAPPSRPVSAIVTSPCARAALERGQDIRRTRRSS